MFIGVHPWLKIQTPIAPNVHRKMILARRSSPRANRKSARSAPVPGRSNVANQAAIETSNAHRRPFLAAAGDGHTPPNVQRKMILARRSSPAPSARPICRTKTKIKFQPRRGGIFRSLRTATMMALLRSFGIIAVRFYKDASPTGLKNNSR